MNRLFILFLFIISIQGNSQTENPYVIEWEKTYGGSGVDYFMRVFLKTSDGGYLLGGNTTSNDGDIQSGNQGKTDSWLIKVDNMGNIEWEKTYGGSENEKFKSSIQTPDGGYLLLGVTSSNDGDVQSGIQGSYDIWVVKIDVDGNIEWEKTYGGSGQEYSTKILNSTSEGGYLFSGYTPSNDGDVQSGIQGSYDIWVVKIDVDGNIEWEKTYGGSEWELLYSTNSTSDDGYILGGFTRSNDGDIQSGNNGNYDYWVVKIDVDGNIEWEKTYGGSFDDYLIPMTPTPDGGYILGGSTKSNNGDIQSENYGEKDCWVVKINNTGTIEWEKTYGGSLDDQISSIQLLSDGGYLLGGYTKSNNGDIQSGNQGEGDYWVIKINNTGTIEWEKTYGGFYHEGIITMIPTNNNGYLLGGWTESNDGDIQSGNKGNIDLWLVKIGIETTGIEEQINENVKVYPNPITENSFTIETPFNHSVQLNLLDIHGRTILTTELLQNTNKITLDGVSDGLYFIQLIDENKIVHQQKMIKRN